MKDITVLLTSCGGPGSPGVISSLKMVKERKIKIIGCDMKPDASGLYMVDVPYTVPPIQSIEYVTKLIGIIEKERVDVLLPSSSLELIKLAKAREKIENAGTALAGPTLEQLKLIVNKEKCYGFLKYRGVSIPNYFVPRDLDEFKQAVYELGYPEELVCFKPVSGSGTRGFVVLRDNIDKNLLLGSKFTHIVSNLDNICEILSKGEFPNLIVMEYLPGDEYSNDLLVDNGKSLFVVPRLRVKVKAGVSHVGVVENNPEVIEACKDIARLLKLHGNANIQLKYSKDGGLKLIEINPRISGTIVLATAAGVNLPYYGIKLALGEKIPITEIKFGTKMIRYLKGIYIQGGQSWQL